MCQLEYRSDAITCSDCGGALVSGPLPPPKPNIEWLDLDTVLVTDDHTLLLVARSLLEAEEIHCTVPGERLQDMFGFGRMISGYNFAFGFMALQVPRERSQEARVLLGVPDVGKPEAPSGVSYHCPRCKAIVSAEEVSCPKCGAQFELV